MGGIIRGFQTVQREFFSSKNLKVKDFLTKLYKKEGERTSDEEIKFQNELTDFLNLKMDQLKEVEKAVSEQASKVAIAPATKGNVTPKTDAQKKKLKQSPQIPI